MAETPIDSWHLDKRIPIALIITLTVQLGAGIWFLSAAFKDIETNRNDISRINGDMETNVRALSARLDNADRNANSQAVQLGRVEEIMQSVRADVSRILNTLESRRGPPWGGDQ